MTFKFKPITQFINIFYFFLIKHLHSTLKQSNEQRQLKQRLHLRRLRTIPLIPGQRSRVRRQNHRLRRTVPTVKKIKKVPGNDLPPRMPQKSFHLLQPLRSRNLKCCQKNVLLQCPQRYLHFQLRKQSTLLLHHRKRHDASHQQRKS